MLHEEKMHALGSQCLQQTAIEIDHAKSPAIHSAKKLSFSGRKGRDVSDHDSRVKKRGVAIRTKQKGSTGMELPMPCGDSHWHFYSIPVAWVCC